MQDAFYCFSITLHRLLCWRKQEVLAYRLSFNDPSGTPPLPFTHFKPFVHRLSSTGCAAQQFIVVYRGCQWFLVAHKLRAIIPGWDSQRCIITERAEHCAGTVQYILWKHSKADEVHSESICDAVGFITQCCMTTVLYRYRMFQ